MSIITAVIVFGIIVVVHEIGHFLAARASGIFVVEFAIGMGPRLFGFERKGTQYSLRLFPIGGFCKMLGEDEDNEDSRAFGNRKLSGRIMTISMGVIFNFALAFLIFTLLVMTGVLNEPVVRKVIPGAPAEAAGLEPGDRVIRVDGTKINIYEDMIYALDESGGRPVNVTLLRSGQRLDRVITPRLDESGQYLIGFELYAKTGIFAPTRDDMPRAGFFESIVNGFWRMLFYIKITLLGILKLVTLKVSVNQMAGPIGIVDMISQSYQSAASAGVAAVVITIAQFTALLSANLGVFNLLPLPALDGGRLIFLVLEGIRRKPVSPDKEGLIHFVGFVALIAFAIFIAFNDIMKLFK